MIQSGKGPLKLELWEHMGGGGTGRVFNDKILCWSHSGMGSGQRHAPLPPRPPLLARRPRAHTCVGPTAEPHP